LRLFGGRTAELETMNRILTESARERAERVEELERAVEAYGPMKTHLSEARARVKELEEAATSRAARIQELERELREALTEFAAKDFPRVEAEREFYRKRMQELETHNQQLTEAATRYALRVQELQEQLFEFLPEAATRD
jgi:chromosome segregation ATPase